MAGAKTFWIGLSVSLALGLAAYGTWKWAGGSPMPNSDGAESNAFVSGGDMNMILSASEVDMYERQATAGDNHKAQLLANHYAELGQAAEERRWLTLAANRGDCAAMSLLRGNATRAGDRRSAAEWNNMLRQHACTWAKAYGQGVESSPADRIPLWEDEGAAGNQH